MGFWRPDPEVNQAIAASYPPRFAQAVDDAVTKLLEQSESQSPLRSNSGKDGWKRAPQWEVAAAVVAQQLSRVGKTTVPVARAPSPPKLSFTSWIGKASAEDDAAAAERDVALSDKQAAAARQQKLITLEKRPGVRMAWQAHSGKRVERTSHE